MTVSDLPLKMLAAHGMRHLFGIPGDAINDVTDALRRQDEIQFIGVRPAVKAMQGKMKTWLDQAAKQEHSDAMPIQEHTVPTVLTDNPRD